VKRARAVIGANFGDEGKGLVVDYLCVTEGAGMVVRFNGGAQAGHTVVRADGKRHVFHHVGAGTFAGVPTYLSKFFLVNPILFWQEVQELTALGIEPIVYAHPDCLVTTFADMMINQRKEESRGKDRHGSVGVGIHETQVRSAVPDLRITMADLWNRSPRLKGKLQEICSKYARFRTGQPIPVMGSGLRHVDEMIDAFLKCCDAFAQVVAPLGIQQCRDPIFEGAQGLLLDQNNKLYWPHVTHSNTGLQNVRELCHTAGIDKIEPYYVSRTYLTRHGAGPLPGEDDTLLYFDETNGDHEFQGRLRFAPLDYMSMWNRCCKDVGSDGKFRLVLTHCDQTPALKPEWAHLHSFGPARSDIKKGGVRCVSA
jgi:adenylosuccinate synthase